MANYRKSIRLKEIKEEMLELLDEALEQLTPEESLRAQRYWYAHIKTAILDEHEYCGGSMVTMEESISEMKKLKGERVLDFEEA